MKRINRVLEIVFLVLFGIYLVSLVPRDSMLFLQFPEWYGQAMFWSLVGIAALRLLLKGLYHRKKYLPGIILLLIVVGLYFLVWSYYPETYVTLPFIAVLTAGCFDMDHRWILGMFLATVGTFFLVTLIAGIIGAVTDLIYFNGEAIRSSLGGVYPTDMASKLLFVLMALWVAKKKLPDWIMLLLGLGSMWFSWFVTRSDTSFICSIAFELVIIYYLLEIHVFRKHCRLAWINKAVNGILIASFPLCAAVFFVLVLLYQRGSSFALHMDILLSDRLRLTTEAIQEHGMSLIGTPFEMIGHGASVINNSNYYNMVDSSYAQFLVYYGIMLFALLCVLWIIMVRNSIKNENRRLAFIIGLVAFHSISEHHFLGLGYNIFLILPFSSFAVSKEIQIAEKYAVREFFSKRWISVILTGIISIVGGLFVLPKALTQLRTLAYLGNHGRENDWIAAILIILFLAVIVFFVWSVYRIIQAVLDKRRGKTLVQNCIPMLISLVVIVLALLSADRLFQYRVQRIENILKEEQKVLSIAAGASDGGICVGTEPAVYQKYMKGIQNSVLAGEELARFRNHTVLLSVDKEYNVLLQTGYLFLQISDEHAIYTDEQNVIKALLNAGYHLTGYYNLASEVDLEYEAGLNGLLYSENGILVDGNVNSLTYGPYVDLYTGQYSATYELALPEKTLLDDSVLCTLVVSSYWGQKILTEKQVLCSEFDENGRLIIKIPFTVPKGGARYVEFKLFAEDNKQVMIRGICYGKEPAYDIHTMYDRDLRIIREEYYSLNGKPIIQPAGHFGIENEYDEKGQLITRRYVDLENNQVLRIDGYSEVHWNYNEQGKKIGQIFLDSEERMVDDDDLNLAVDLPPGWSEWIIPDKNTMNSWLDYSSFFLGEKKVGDTYTCQIEVEFRDVTATENEPFVFRTQGAVDGSWDKDNVWNRNLIYLDTPPEDGIYYYTSTVQITENNVDSGIFNIGFRCDNWASGSFRVNHIKVEKGSEPSDWDQGI